MADQNQNTQQEGGNDAPSFNLQRVYLKDLSLEMPNAPHVFLEQEAPQVEVSIAVGGQRADTVFETTVTVTVTTRINDKVVYGRRHPGRHLRSRQHPRRAAGSAAGHRLPDHALPVPARQHRRRDHPHLDAPLHLTEVNFQALYEQRRPNWPSSKARPTATAPTATRASSCPQRDPPVTRTRATPGTAP